VRAWQPWFGEPLQRPPDPNRRRFSTRGPRLPRADTSTDNFDPQRRVGRWPARARALLRGAAVREEANGGGWIPRGGEGFFAQLTFLGALISGGPILPGARPSKAHPARRFFGVLRSSASWLGHGPGLHAEAAPSPCFARRSCQGGRARFPGRSSGLMARPTAPGPRVVSSVFSIPLGHLGSLGGPGERKLSWRRPLPPQHRIADAEESARIGQKLGLRGRRSPHRSRLV